MCYTNNVCDMTVTMKCILPSCLDSAYHGDTNILLQQYSNPEFLQDTVYLFTVHPFTFVIFHSVQLFN